jgi:hypothetical protein
MPTHLPGTGFGNSAPDLPHIPMTPASNMNQSYNEPPAPPAANSLAPSFQEIQQIIDIKLAQHSSNNNQNIIVLPPLQQLSQKSEPIEINLQFVNPDGTKTDVNNQQVHRHVLNKKDFVSENPGNNDPFRMKLKMGNNISLEKLYTMISLNPQSFYQYFTKLMSKKVVTRRSIMFKGLTLGKLMDYIKNQYNIGGATLMVGSSRS